MAKVKDFTGSENPVTMFFSEEDNTEREVAKDLSEKKVKEKPKETSEKKNEGAKLTGKRNRGKKMIEIEDVTNKALGMYKERTGLTQSDIIEEALRKYIPKKYFDFVTDEGDDR